MFPQDLAKCQQNVPVVYPRGGEQVKAKPTERRGLGCTRARSSPVFGPSPEPGMHRTGVPRDTLSQMDTTGDFAQLVSGRSTALLSEHMFG
jgi:hypothetical protein